MAIVKRPHTYPPTNPIHDQHDITVFTLALYRGLVVTVRFKCFPFILAVGYTPDQKDLVFLRPITYIPVPMNNYNVNPTHLPGIYRIHAYKGKGVTQFF